MRSQDHALHYSASCSKKPNRYRDILKYRTTLLSPSRFPNFSTVAVPLGASQCILRVYGHQKRRLHRQLQPVACATMADDPTRRISEEIITEFFLGSWQLRRRVTEYDVRAAGRCTEIATLTYRRADHTEFSYIPLITGSLAEFYIKPILSCFGDVDIMAHRSNQLAIPARYAPPTQLPGEFGSCVEVYEIVHSEFSGYVYLERSYLLTECVDVYNAVPCERLLAVNGSSDADNSRHGPALVNEHHMVSLAFGKSAFGIRHDAEVHSVDSVFCMRCLWWPPQAAAWATRHRRYSWPDSATINNVVSNGCDVVGVAHPLCRQDEWMRKHQWRLSFSRAEITLLNSWMPVQQIVYHMLRCFMKTERLTGSAADKSETRTLSNYHIKTLMLWACELKSRSWWTDNPNLVGICVKLLHTLADWLTDANCQQYFINTCNIFYQLKESVFRQATTNRLLSITRQVFCEWCIGSYMRRCAEHCHWSVLRQFQDASSRTLYDGMHRVTCCLQNAASAIVKWSIDMSQKMAVIHLIVFQFKIIGEMSRSSLTLRSCLYWTSQLAKADQGLYVFFVAALFLHVAYKTTQGLLTDEMLDVLAIGCLRSNNARRYLNARQSSMLSLNQAAILMKVVANSSYSTVQLIEIELSKAYLYRALRCKDCDSNSIYCLANVFLAVLYYSTGQYQAAIDHCTLVTRLQDCSQSSSHVVQGEHLPSIDNQVDCSLGLPVFYQYIREAVLNEEQDKRHVSVFTAELFAHYLHVKFLSVAKCHQLPETSLADAKRRYRYRFCNSSEIFITDVIAFSFAKHARFLSNNQQVMYDRVDTKSLKLHQLDTSKLVQLLQQSAVEHLSTYRELESRHIGFLGMGHLTFTWDFKALYAYKCGQYDCCLQLSMRTVHTLIVNRRETYQFLLLIPECVQLLLLDDELVSLIGLAVLVKPPSDKSNSLVVFIHQLVLSLYLMTQCQIKLRHSMASLATTLDYIRLARSDIGQTLKYVLDDFGVDDRCVADRHVLNFVEQMILKYIPVSHKR